MVGQILRYIGWVKDNLCTPEQHVRGMVICNEADQRLQWAVKPVAGLIQVKLYRVDFQLVDPLSLVRERYDTDRSPPGRKVGDLLRITDLQSSQLGR